MFTDVVEDLVDGGVIEEAAADEAVDGKTDAKAKDETEDGAEGEAD